ncbi:MAG: glycosyltransferase [bacterium]|nr:glycosyltransferase [bacterium]
MNQALTGSARPNTRFTTKHLIEIARLFPIFAAGVALNIWCLHNFNTLTWPYLWPQPGIFVVMAVFVLCMWFPECFSGKWAFRIVGLIMFFIGECYVIHSIDVLLDSFSVIGLMHAIGVSCTFCVMTLCYINQLNPRDNRTAPPLPEDLPYVAAVIPTYGEPVEILRETALSLKNMEYPEDRRYIFISDDGHREEVERMAAEIGVGYNKGAKKDAKAGNLNAALRHIEEVFPKATLILTQDADEVIDRSFLQKVIGYFTDPKIAFVQTPKDATCPPGDPFGVRDRVFYDRIQPGRNGSGAAFACGSGVVWRIEAVKSIGGFAVWNIVEDLTTSYFIHSAGWKSEYHNEILSIGLAPDDVPGLLKQRGTWAADTWRLFLFNNPITRPGLTFRQRMQYTELGLFYVTSTFFMPMLMLTPLLSLITGHFIPIQGAALFPWLGASFLFYVVLSGGDPEFLKLMWQYWIGHFATYFKAFRIAIKARKKKPSYKVTRKTRQAGFYGGMLWMQFSYLFLGLIAIVRGLFFLPEAALAARLTNIGILLFFMFMVSGICQAALYGVKLPHQKLAAKFKLLFSFDPPSPAPVRATEHS